MARQPKFPIEISLDLDDPRVQAELSRWGGASLVRLNIWEHGKRATVWLSARVSGDIRAGKTTGAHVRLTAVKRSTDTVRELHVSPWIKSRRAQTRTGACEMDGCGLPGTLCRDCGGAMCDAHAASGYSCCSGGIQEGVTPGTIRRRR